MYIPLTRKKTVVAHLKSTLASGYLVTDPLTMVIPTNSKMHFQYFQIHRDCNGHPTTQDCTGQEFEKYWLDVIKTSFVRFTCVRRCINSNNWIGIREAYIWGF